MLRQSSRRSNRSMKLRPKHSLQAFLLVAVSLWLMYQLAHSYGKRRRGVVVENAAAAVDGEVTRRRLGRKGFVDFAGDDASHDDGGVRGIAGGNVGIEADMERGMTSEPHQLSSGKQGGVDGDEEANEDDADDGLPGDEDDGGRDFHLSDETDGGVAPLLNSSDGAAVPSLNYAADGIDKTAGINTALSDSGVSKNSSVVASLRPADGDINMLTT
ncbi:hypothetical protein ABZP36_006692 [Zizania latifolia]